MIRLNLSQGPRWISLGYGVELQVEPLTAVTLKIAGNDPRIEGLAPDIDPDVRFAHLTNVVAELAITDWRGVGDVDGNPLPVTPKAVAALMAVPQLHRAFSNDFVAPAFLVVAEKNVFAPSLNGTSAAGEITARPASESVTPARAARTRRKPTKARLSGN